MAKVGSRDRIREADEAAIRSAVLITLMRFVGREAGVVPRASLWDRTEFPTDRYGSAPSALAAARFARDVEVPPDPYGRRAMIYAVTPTGRSVFVE